MKQWRRTLRNHRWAFLCTLLFLAGGQAAFAVWYPAYADNGEYMGCTHIPGFLEPGDEETVNMGEVGCWIMVVIGMGTADDPPLPVGHTFADGATFAKNYGLTSDSLVQNATTASAAEMRRRAQSLQAAALDLLKAAEVAEGLDSKAQLERWIDVQLRAEPPVCTPSSNR